MHCRGGLKGPLYTTGTSRDENYIYTPYVFRRIWFRFEEIYYAVHFSPCFAFSRRACIAKLIWGSQRYADVRLIRESGKVVVCPGYARFT